MKARKKNIYFGLGPAPTPSKREKRRQRTEFQAGVKRKRATLKREKRRQRTEFQAEVKREKRRQRTEFQAGVKRKRATLKREKRRQRTEFQAEVKRKRATLKRERQELRRREKESATLFKQLQRDAKPQRARRAKWTPQDEEAWQQMLRENPMRQFPGNLTASEISALRKLARLKTMSSKKKQRRKKKNPNGVMPPGLKRWHAEQKRKKAKKKNPRKRKPKATRTRRPRRKPVSMRVRNGMPRLTLDEYRAEDAKRIARGETHDRYGNRYATPDEARDFFGNYRKPAKKRRRKANPRPQRRVKIIKTNLRKGTKAFRQFVQEQRAKYGSARVL